MAEAVGQGRIAAEEAPPEFGTITLGTVQLGLPYGIANRSGRPDDTEARRILGAAVAGGVTHLDTARAYGDSEERIGEFAEGAVRRFAIITKVRPLVGLSPSAGRKEVHRAVDTSIAESLRALRRTRLDVVMLHRFADVVGWEGAALERLAELAVQGQVGEIGASVYDPSEASECLRDRRIRHLQIPFNLLDSRWLAPGFQRSVAERPEVKIHARSVFLQGLLIADAKTWPAFVADAAGWVDRLHGLRIRCGRESLGDLCIGFVRAFPWVTSLVLGAERADQLEESLRWSRNTPLMPDEVRVAMETLAGAPARLLNPSLW